MKVRTTLVLEEIVLEKLRQQSKNISETVNAILKQEPFKKKSMFGALKGVVSTKDLIEMEKEEARAEKAHERMFGRKKR